MNTEVIAADLRTLLKDRTPHNPDEIRVRIRDAGQPCGAGTNIIFRSDDEQSATDKITAWLSLFME